MTPPHDNVSDVERLRVALGDIMEHFSWRDRGPGHHHTIKGVWDDDASNGDRAGKPCEWCATAGVLMLGSTPHSRGSTRHSIRTGMNE